MEAQLAELKRRLIEVNDLMSAAALLSWDQSTYMPPGGAAARSRQMATLQQLAHEKFTDAAVGQLLGDLRTYGDSLPYDSDDAALIRVAQRDYRRSAQVPSSFVAEFANHAGLTFDAWTRARPANDFAGLRPLVEKTLDLSRECRWSKPSPPSPKPTPACCTAIIPKRSSSPLGWTSSASTVSTSSAVARTRRTTRS